jgi:spermidine synthase
MVIEITAYRLLAPLYGNSVFTWTALIGVILIAFSAGGYLGGWLAERKAEFTLIGWLLVGAAVVTLLVPLTFSAMAPLLGDVGLIAGPLIISIILFIIPGVLLGAISPASVRLYSLLGKDEQVGFAAGMISMIGSLGSFAGTVLSGFYLLSNFGVQGIFLGTGLVLIMLASVAFFLARNPPGTHVPAWLAGVAGLTFGASASETTLPGTLFRQNSYYHEIAVVEEGTGADTKRFLNLDSVRNGGMKVSDGGIAVRYQEYWRMPVMKPGFAVKHALFMGAGAFAMPEQLSLRYPEANVEVCEIDPHVIEVGRRFFKLDEFPRVNSHAGDARHFLRTSVTKYEVIFGDAYASRSVPTHLASKEFFQLVHDRITPDGIFVMNVISAAQGPRSEMLAGMIATLREVFPHLEIFAVGSDPALRQNLMVLASKESWTPMVTADVYAPGSPEAAIVRSRIPPERWPTGGVVFTDNLNPVDGIISRGEMMDREIAAGKR